jgi:activator of HSP90 ATPase
MTTKNFELKTELPCSAETAFSAWLDSRQHGDMVEGEANIDPQVGGVHSIWDGAITGVTTEIDASKHRIVQEWVYDYDDWPKDQPSLLTIEFKPVSDGRCELHMQHSTVPAQYADDVKLGWEDYYFKPMKAYFGKTR